MMNNTWLPTTKEELESRGWDRPDVIIVSGDAYVDHPSFGHAVISRILEKAGLKVAILAQPNWRDDLRDFKKLGAPRLFFGITAGCMDSMVNHYTAGKRLRSDDAYTPGDKTGFRPDYATTVYSKILKNIYPEIPVIIGGVEASLRRFTHYDYWQDKLLPSILIDSGADILVYGAGEKPIIEIAELMNKGVPINNIINVRQTVFLNTGERLKQIHKSLPGNERTIYLPSHDECITDKKLFAKSFCLMETESNKIDQALLIQFYGKQAIIANPPVLNYSTDEIDNYFEMPYTRLPHPKYAKRGDIQAYNMIKNSITIHRGCFGGCSFCTISAHQGKAILSRSEESILKELDIVANTEGFKGHISDIGGPSANMYKMEGLDKNICRKCSRPSCIFPSHCKNLNSNHNVLTNLYKKASLHPKINKITIGSGIRYDLLINSPYKKEAEAYTKQLITKHVSGRLKVAPEHNDNEITALMRKPVFGMFYKFKNNFDIICKRANLKQQIIPYFISSHPGCTIEKMAQLAIETKKLDFHLEQVQDFTPTPMTLSSTMYYCGFDPYSLKPLYSAKTKEEKQSQKDLFFWYDPKFYNSINTNLSKIGRKDLINSLLPTKFVKNLKYKKR